MKIPEKYNKTKWDSEIYIEYMEIVRIIAGEGDLYEKIGQIKAHIDKVDIILEHNNDQ